jgi:hypothetical protein
MKALIALGYSSVLFFFTSPIAMKNLLTLVWERVVFGAENVVDASCRVSLLSKKMPIQALFSGAVFWGKTRENGLNEQNLFFLLMLISSIFITWLLVKIIQQFFLNFKLLNFLEKIKQFFSKNKKNDKRIRYEFSRKGSAHNFELISKKQKESIMEKRHLAGGHIFVNTKYPALLIGVFLLFAIVTYNIPEKYQLAQIFQSRVNSQKETQVLGEAIQTKIPKTKAKSNAGVEMVLAEATNAEDTPIDIQTGNKRTIQLTGMLTDNAGKPVEGSYETRFSLYTIDRTTFDPYPSNSDKDSRIWEETRTVIFKKGLFVVNLGQVEELPILTGLENSQFYVGMRIGTDSEMAPRRKVSTPLFSLNSANALLLNGKKIGIASGDIVALNDQGQINLANLPIGKQKDQLVLGSDKRLSSQLTVSGASFISLSGQSMTVEKVDLSSDTSGALAVAQGGLGLATYTTGDMLYYSSGAAFTKLGVGTEGQVLVVSSGVPAWSATAPAASHDLLSTPHSDTTPGVVLRGDLIAGQGATAKWSRLALGTNGQLLRSNGTDILWSDLTKSDVGLGNVENTALSTWLGTTNITTLGTITSGTWNGSTVSVDYGGTGVATYTTGDMLYYSSGTILSKLPIGVNGQVLIVENGIPAWGSASAGSAHNFLSDSHSDTTAGTVLRGDLITGQGATTKWNRLALGTIGQVLLSNGTDVTWASLTKSDVGLGNVENTTLSTWAGTTNITTLGTITAGIWSGSEIADAKIATAMTGKTYNGLAITATTGTLTVGNLKTLTVNNILAFSGTDNTTMTFPATSATIARTDAGQTFSGTQIFSSTITGSISGNAETVTNGVYTNAANSMTLINPLTTIAESWIGPSSTAGIYFKAGNVGIGTTSPDTNLHIAGQIKITGGTPGLSKVLTSDANGLATWTTIGSGSISDSYLFNTGDTGIGAYTFYGGIFSINDSSNYATNINTGTSTGTVTIGGSVAQVINIGAGAGANTIALGGGAGTLAINTGDWDISTTGALTGISGITTDGAYTQSGTDANTFTGISTFSNATYSALFTGGNVGIGTATPSNFKLEVAGDIGPEGDNTRNLGSPTKYFNTAYIKNLVTGTSGTVGYWLRTGNVLSPVTNGDTMAIYAGAANTSGTLLNVAYSNNVTLSGALIGAKIDLNDGYVVPTNQPITGLRVVLPTTTNTNSSGTTVTMDGMSLGFGNGSGINQDGTGTTIYSGANLLMPALTQTAGTLIANGVLVTTSSSITTNGTANGLNISATGVGAGSLNGVKISNITGSGGVETALSIGSGWDSILSVNGDQVIDGNGVVNVTAGGTGITTYTAGDILYASGASAFTKLAGGTSNNGKVLVISGGVPTWGVPAGSSCTDCVLNDPTSVTTQTITPNNQDISSLVVRQTTYSTPTHDIFAVTSADGGTRYFYVDQNGNVSTGGVSSQSITLTPTSNTTALTLVGTNVSTANLEYINARNIQGSIFNLAYGGAATLAGALTGAKIDLATNVTATDQSVTGLNITLPATTNTTSTSNYQGLVISALGGAGINQTGSGITIFSGMDITIPSLTQTAGSLTGNGILITTPSSITTGGTANGLNIAATGIGSGTLRGVNVGNITAGAGAETALRVGTGWDYAAIFEGGNVGIGTTGPTGMLHLAQTPGALQATPTLAFGDGDTGFYEATDDNMYLSIGGAKIAQFGSSGIFGNDNNAFGLMNEAVSSTNPTLVPTRADFDTGIGWAGDNILSLIAGGTNVMNITNGNVGIGIVNPKTKLSVGVSFAASESIIGQFASEGGALDNASLYIGGGSYNVPNRAGMKIYQTWDGADTDYSLGLYTGDGGGVGSGERLTISPSGNVGIGTTGPGVKMQVVGQSGTGSIGVMNITGYDSSGQSLVMQLPSTGYTGNLIALMKAAGSSGQAMGFSTHFTSDVVDRFSVMNHLGAENLTVLDSGNVGIGTTAPGAKLDVFAGTNIPDTSATLGSGIRLSAGSATKADSYLNFWASSTTSPLSYGAGRIHSGWDLSAGADWNESYIAFQTHATDSASWTDDMIIKGGNVGIGTATPGYLLDVFGSAKVLSLNINGAYSLATDAGTSGYVLTSNGVGGTSWLPASGGSSPWTVIGNDIYKNNSGNIGIGTTTPAELFSIGSSSQFQVDASGNIVKIKNLTYNWPNALPGAGGYALTSDALGNFSWALVGGGSLPVGVTGQTIYYNGSSWVATNSLFNAGTNIGIGTSSPAALFAVGATSQFQVDSNGYLTVPAGSAGSPSVIFTGAGSGTGLWSVGANTLNVSIGSSEKLRIDSSGNFGFNQSSPDEMVTLGSSGNSGGRIHIYSASNPSVTTDKLWNNNGHLYWGGSSVVDLSSGLNIAGSTGQTLYNNGTTWVAASNMYNDATNVGIGTTAPAALFSVGSTSQFQINSSGTVTYPVGSVNSPSIIFAGSAGSGFWSSGSDTLNVSINNSEKLRIDSSGNFGFSQTSPDEMITLGGSGNSGGRIHIFDSNQPGTITNRLWANGGSLYWGGSSAVNISSGLNVSATTGQTLYYDGSVWAASSSLYNNSANGNIGIGTTSPQALLDVNGVAAVDPGTVSTPSLAFRTDLNTGMWSSGGDTINFSTNATERIRIDSSGNIGIGTTSPTSILQTNGGHFILGALNGSNAAEMRFNEGSNNGTEYISLKAPDSITNSLTLTLPLADGSSGQVLQTNGSGVLSWAANAAAGGMSNPMTTLGDLIYASDSNSPASPARLAVGSNGQCLVITGGLPAWGSCSGTSAAAGANTQVQFNNSGPFGASANFIWDNTNYTLSSLGTVAGAKISLALRNSSAGATANNELRIGNNSSANALSLLVNSSGYTGAVNYAYIYNTLNAPLLFGTNNTERMRIINTGNIGIGTTTPLSLLDVNGVGAFDLGLVNAPSFSFRGDLNTGMWSSGVDTVNFSTAGNERMRISSTGNIGIGTTVPSRPLDVRAARASRLTVLRLGTSNASSATNDEVSADFSWYGASDLYMGRISGYIQNNTTNDSGLKFYTAPAGVISANPTMTLDSAGNVSIGTTLPLALFDVNGVGAHALGAVATPSFAFRTDLNTGMWSSGSDTLNFSTAGTERFRVTSTGNIGIGTTAAGQLFTIGANTFQVNSSGNIVKINNITYSWPSAQAGGANYVLSNNGSGTLSWLNASTINAFVQSGNSFGATAVFGTNDGYDLTLRTNSAERMRILSSGNVGIGTTNPLALLDVNGVAATALGAVATPSFAFRTDLNTGMWSSGSDTLNFSTTGSERMRINSGGNVGIGTTNPLALLDVNGVAATALGAVATPSFAFRTDLNTGMWSSGADTLNFSTAGSERMQINSGGNVGIGTTSPGAKLTVMGAGGVADALVFSMREGNNPTYGWDYTLDDLVDGDLILNRVNAGVRSQMMTFERNSGEIGIGTTSPLALLDVNGVTATALGAVATPSFAFRTDLDTGMWSSGSDTLNFSTVGSERMRINNIGNVGIGTTNPLTLLDVNGVAATALGAVATPSFAFRTDLNTGMWSSGADTLNFSTNSTERMQINSGGNIGIGTTTLSARMDINTPNDGSTVLRLGNGGGLGFNFLRVSATGALSIQGEQTGNNNILLAPTSGNIGIGTTSPLALLDVNGVGAHSLGAVATPSFAFRTDLNTGMWSSGADTVNFSTAGTERMRIDLNGNVGINNSSPDEFLTLGNGSYNGRIHIYDSSQPSTITNKLWAAGGNLYWGGSSAVNLTAGLNISGTTGQTLYYNGSAWAASSIIYNNGTNVGIGTTSPLSGYRLTVGSSAAFAMDDSGKAYFPAGASNLPSMTFLNNSGTGIWSSAGNTLNFSTNSTERMRIDSNGYVGIGASPSYKLDVRGSGVAGQINAEGGLCINGTCVTSWSASGSGTLELTAAANTYIQDNYTGGDSTVNIQNTTSSVANLWVEGTITSGPNANALQLPFVADAYIEDNYAGGDSKINIRNTTGSVANLWVEGTITSGPNANALQLPFVADAYIEDNYAGGDSKINIRNTTGSVANLWVEGTITSGPNPNALQLPSVANTYIEDNYGGGDSMIAIRNTSYGPVANLNVEGAISSGPTANSLLLASTNAVYIESGYGVSDTTFYMRNSTGYNGHLWVEGAITSGPTSNALQLASSNAVYIESNYGSGDTTFYLRNSSGYNGHLSVEGEIASGLSGYFATSSGNVGIGLSSGTTQKLDVNGNARIRSIGSGAYANPVNQMSDGTLTTATSDVRFKQNIVTIENPLDKVMALRGVTYNWKDPNNPKRMMGMIAQEVSGVVPELVFQNSADGYYGISYGETSGLLIEAIKAQQGEITSHEVKIDSLTGNQNRIVEQLTGQLADQTLTVNSKLQLIGASLDQLATKQIKSLKDQLSDQNKDLAELRSQMEDIRIQNKAFSDFLLAFDLNSLDNFAKINAPVNIFSGQLEAEGIVAGAFSVKVKDDKAATIGTSKIKPKEDDSDDTGKNVIIKTKAVSSDSKIYITPIGSTKNQVLYVGEIKSGASFEVKVDSLVTEEIEFNWWIVGKK